MLDLHGWDVHPSVQPVIVPRERAVIFQVLSFVKAPSQSSGSFRGNTFRARLSLKANLLRQESVEAEDAPHSSLLFSDRS